MTQTDPNAPKTNDIIEELQVVGEQLLSKVKELVHEGNVRRIRIKQEGHVILELPLAIGVVGVILAPAMAAIGAMGALLAQCSIEVVRSERPVATTRTFEEPLPPTDGPEQTL
jgi:DNA polymerase II small subunit/DNA polymerase delta subunit B